MNSLACKAAALLVALLPVYGAMPVPAEDSPYFIKERIIPPEYKIAGEFLEYLKPVNGSVEFSANAAPKWDIARLLSFISPDGLAATDVNRGGKLVHYTPQQIRNSVTARKGYPFRTFSHVGHIYAQPYKQYSELFFEARSDGGVVMHMADWYMLTFGQQLGGLRAARIDYLMREGH